jgi:hypothetical protein
VGVVEIMATQWDEQPRFSSADDFLAQLDRLARPKVRPARSPRAFGFARRHHPMHLLLILVILMLAFPGFARLVGGVLSIVFWLVLVVVVLAVFGAMSH